MDAIYEGISLPCDVLNRAGRHEKSLKQNLVFISFCPFVYSIVGGFEGDGFAKLDTKFLSSAMNSGFYIIRNIIYLIGKKNKKERCYIFS